MQQSEVHGAVSTILVGAIGVGRIGLAFDDLQTNSGYAVGTRSYADAPISIDRGDERGSSISAPALILASGSWSQIRAHVASLTQAFRRQRHGRFSVSASWV